MKKILSLCLPMAFAVMGVAQEMNMSKADILANTTGAVIQREYLSIATVDEISIIVENITNIATNQKLSAVDMEYKTGSGDNATTVSVLLDPDEVDLLILFIQSIQDRISATSAPQNYTEYTFVSRSDFEAGCYWSKGWKTYFKLDKEDSHSDVEFNKEDLMTMLSTLRQAKSKL